MRLVAITRDVCVGGEADSIKRIIDSGFYSIHIRKPKATEADVRRLLDSLPSLCFPKLTLGSHLNLADEYPVGGIHLNSKMPLSDVKSRGLRLSRSCHSADDLSEAETYDYVFLSPIFDSISKQGYGAAFSEEQLLSIMKNHVWRDRIVALGGVDAEHLPYLSHLGFTGAAFLGYLFNDLGENVLRQRLELLTKFQ